MHRRQDARQRRRHQNTIPQTIYLAISSPRRKLFVQSFGIESELPAGAEQGPQQGVLPHNGYVEEAGGPGEAGQRRVWTSYNHH